jgi:transcriptional regulator NrdR family protein
MANFVIKKDGTKEPFDTEKIRRSITAAAQTTNLSEERMKEVVDQVSGAAMQLAEGKEEIATSELREKILSELDITEPSVSEAWRRYEQEKGKV